MFESLFKKLEELKEVLSKGDDALDAKIKAKLKAEMDKRKFGEADAIRHVIDRDRGDAAAKLPKPKEQKPLLQSESEQAEEQVVKIDSNGQWSL